MKTRLILAGVAASTIGSMSARADVTLNDNFSLGGYAVGAYTYTDTGSGHDDTFLDSGVSNYDAVKLALTGKFDAFSATVSGFYVPNLEPDEVGVLDAYASFTTGSLTITGGKFLSYLGYEAFDPVNMTQITYGETIFAIPGYHTGLKFDYSTDAYGFGLAAVDSVFAGSGFFQGDGEFSDDVGFEGYFTYKAVKDLTVFLGFAYEDTDGASDSLTILDLWASYKVSDSVTVAGEIDYQDDVAWGWLGFVQYTFNEQFSVIGRISGKLPDVGDDLVQFTVAPTFKVNEHVSFRAEASVTTGGADDVTFFGVQAVLKL